MKLKLKTATLIAMIASGLYALMQIISIFTDRLYYIHYIGFEYGASALVRLFFSIALFLFFYSLYQNQKK